MPPLPESLEAELDLARWARALESCSADPGVHFECCFRPCMLQVSERFRGEDPHVDYLLDTARGSAFPRDRAERFALAAKGEHVAAATVIRVALSTPDDREPARGLLLEFGERALEAGASSKALVSMLERVEQRARSCPSVPAAKRSWWRRPFG